MNSPSSEKLKSNAAALLTLSVLFVVAPVFAPAAPVAEPRPLSMQVTVVVSRFRFEGNSVFSENDLADELASYLNRPLFLEDLEEARTKLTMRYVNAGYINSGAILPEQTVKDGVVTFRIVEGRLTRIDIGGLEHLREDYVRDRVALGLDGPLNINTLKERLEIVRQNPNLRAINADLKPGSQLGEATLDVQAHESEPFNFGLRFNNRRAPSVGAERFIAVATHSNLTGRGDSLFVEWGLTTGGLEEMEFAGLDDITVAYAIPIAPDDTTLGFSYERSDSLVIEEPFTSLDISSLTETFALTLRHPVMRTPISEFALSLDFEMRSSITFLLGEPFSFSAGDNQGKSDITVFRFSQEFWTRGADSALALRSTFSLGIDAFGATNNPSNVPDGQFVTWLGQAQYVRKLGDTSNQLIARVTVQAAGDSLLSMEQFSLGGFDTVRGYRENQVVRDNAAVFSLEIHVPLIFDATTGQVTLALAPFFDAGTGWNHEDVTGRSETLTSVGIGLLLTPASNFSARIYWGYAFDDFDTDGDLQDMGFHFDVAVLRF